MRSTWTGRHVHFLCFLAAFSVVTISPAFAQRGGNQSSSGSSAGGAAGTGNVGSTGRTPSINNPNYGNIPSSPNVWQNTRPIFLSGRVMFDDGSRPNSDIRVERVCGGNARLEGHTDSKGQFSFQLGQNAMIDTDASDSMSPAYGRSGGTFGGSNNMGGFGNRDSTFNNALFGCELRASYPGYRSDLLELASHRSSDDPNVGTIILHRLGASEGSTVSLTTALVPKHAQKDYEKGVQLAEKGKFEEAEKHLLDATDAYPKYAIAWFALGQLQQREGKTEAARKSYETAIAADAKYVSPYDQLALLSAQGQEWEAAAKYSKQAITLDAVDYPSSFWYNAVANYQLRKVDEVEKSIQALLRVDKVHRYPEAENMYAQVLLSKGNYDEAATHLRTYLTIAPKASGAGQAREQLTKIEQAKAAPAK